MKLLKVPLACAALFTITSIASAQVPGNCAESFFASNNGGGLGGTVFFDLDVTEAITVSGLRTNLGDAAATPVTIEVWTTPTTSVGAELDMTLWTMVGTSDSSAAGTDFPTQFLFGTPLEFTTGTIGVAIVATVGSHRYTNGTGMNEVHVSGDGVVTITGNGASNMAFGPSLFSPRIWNGNLCYDLGSAPCVTTLLESNNGGNVDGAVYFDVTATEPASISSLEVNTSLTAGTACGLDVYITDGSGVGSETDPSAWTLVATDDGMAVSAGDDVPTVINLEAPFSIPPGTTGVALVAVGFNHRYTNGNGPNENHYSADGVLTVAAGSASNVPFTGNLFSPRVWNGRLCRDTADNCVETLFAANNGGAIGGAVYFDVVAATAVTISGLTTNVGEAGSFVGIEVWSKSGTYAGFEANAAAWNLVATGDGMSIGAERDEQTPITFTTPLNLPAGRTGITLVLIGAGHDYTNGNGTNEIHDSQDNILRVEAGSGSNVPFSGNIFNPRVWNGSLCYDAPFLGANFCDPAVANSSGDPGNITAVGSNLVADNNVRLIARNLSNGSSGFFLTSQGNQFVATPGGALGNLCIAGAPIGRYVGPGQVKNSGSNGSFSLLIDLTIHPTPTGLIAVLPGDSWNFQCWHRDLVMGSAVSNFTNALRIQFQ